MFTDKVCYYTNMIFNNVRSSRRCSQKQCNRCVFLSLSLSVSLDNTFAKMCTSECHFLYKIALIGCITFVYIMYRIPITHNTWTLALCMILRCLNLCALHFQVSSPDHKYGIRESDQITFNHWKHEYVFSISYHRTTPKRHCLVFKYSIAILVIAWRSKWSVHQ